MLPTTLQVRAVLNKELKNRDIKTLGTYTDNARVLSDNNRRYITYVISKKVDFTSLKQIVDACNKELPNGKFRITASTPRYSDRYPVDNTYIRATATLEA